MAPRIRPLTPGELTADQSALYAAITGGPRAQGPQHFALTSDDGSLRGPFDLMLRSPAVGTAQQELGAAIRYRTGFTDRMRELAILLVAARWDSAFERESHEAIARALGFSEDELAAIRAPMSRPSPTTSALVGRAVSRCSTATCGRRCGTRHPPPSASTASSNSPRSSGTTPRSRCSCGCSVSSEIARAAAADTVSLYESR